MRVGAPRRAVGSQLVSRAVLTATIVTALLTAGVASGSVEAAKRTQRVIQLYSVTTQEQFLNHADDRARGYGDNPFGNFKAPTATTKEHNNGPFPGDQALFQFNLYSGPKHTKSGGSAIVTCFYNFNHHGFCDAAYQLNGGTILCSGAIDFNAKDFVLIATGGTGQYRGVTGTVESKTVGYAETRLTVKLS
jgi:hypothetical protein